MKSSRVKISHKIFKEFTNLYYYFTTEHELAYFLNEFQQRDFLIEDLKIKGKISGELENYIISILWSNKYYDKDFEDSKKRIKKEIYA